LRAIAYNESHRTDGVRLFEIGKIFGVPAAGSTLPDEREHLAVVLVGSEAPAAVQAWNVLASTLGFTDPSIDQSVSPDGLHPGRSGALIVSGIVVGEIGEIDPGVLDAHGIRGRVAWLQLDLDAALSLGHGQRTYRHISRYPSSDLDLAFEVDDAVTAARVQAVLTDAAGDLLVRMHLFDVFRGPSVPDGQRSLAYRLRLQASDRTLTDEDVASVLAACVAAAATLGGTLRG
jgi:phenylalanyl-tRNA synthetase beta chain